MIGAITKVSFYRAEDRIFTEIIFYESGDEGVDGFVVGHAVTGSVGKRDVAGTVGAHQAGHAEHRVRAETEWIEEIVIHAAVDYVDALEAVDRFHVDDYAVDDKVATFDEFDAHLLGEEAVFEIGAVVDAGSEKDDLGFRFTAGRKHSENAGKLRGVVSHGENFVLVEGFGKGAGHDQAVFEDVGDAAGGADIVFEDVEFAGGGVANEVDAADVGVNAMGDFEAHHFAPEVTTRIDQRRGNFAVLEDLLLTVDILKEKIEGYDALGEAGFDVGPFGLREDSGDKVEGKQALGASAVAIDSEGDALKKKRQIGELAALLKLGGSHAA
jgi:hypothetical protein